MIAFRTGDWKSYAVDITSPGNLVADMVPAVLLVEIVKAAVEMVDHSKVDLGDLKAEVGMVDHS